MTDFFRSNYGECRIAGSRDQEHEIDDMQNTVVEQLREGNLDECTIKDPEDRVYVKFIDNVKGKGLFASRKIEKGELIAFYRGEQITEEQFIEKQKINENEYMFFKHYNIYIDAKKQRSLCPIH